MTTTTVPSTPAHSQPPATAVMGTMHLRGRRQAVRRRRFVLGLRDWLGISVIACFSATLFAITFFSLLGR